MPLLTRFSPPADLDELGAAGRADWHEQVHAVVRDKADALPSFYDPTTEDTPAELEPAVVGWSAFPATLTARHGSSPERWRIADTDRRTQDEYCEWGVERGADGKVVRVTFTTEVPSWWETIAVHDPDLLVELYRRHVHPDARREDLIVDGVYARENPWNGTVDGAIPARPAHLIQESNEHSAAVVLVADATVLRKHADGSPVADRRELVACGGLGAPLRNSDPQIAEAVNASVAVGARIALADPFSLYLDGLQSAGIVAPDDADAAEFWTVERGTDAHAVRASFAVPPERGYTVGDLRIDGRLVRFGAQIAEKVRVRVAVLAKPGGAVPARQPCV